MSIWNSLSFQNSASPLMEQMIFFFDFSFLIMLLVMIFVIYMMLNMILNKYINRYLLENQILELIWTIFPMMILLFMVFPSLRILYLMDEMKNPNMTFKVIGHQWFWSYEYSDFMNIEYDSYMILNNFRLLEVDNSFVVPYNLKIRLLVSSFDVLHSWTVPSLGVKVDAVPGRLNQLNFILNRVGIFFGQCSEICGINHSFMPIMLESIMFKDFLFWLKSN
uniref:cytochrome c oxidase subunit II n=1 Tax=Aleurodicus rugioperculatus TaxID=1608326 RepID=UPI00286AC3FF|nr:cytochrome c oxidase subunit II [Aleurodicus rugioperculatus]WKT15072.1 cytochrome c oxidase subunit II [Aleurodicus rugioperculatus]